MFEYDNVKNFTGIEDREVLREFADIEEAIRLGIARPIGSISASSGKGMVAYIEGWDLYIVSAENDDTAISLMGYLPKRAGYGLCVHGEKAISFAKDFLGLSGSETYYQFVYEGSKEDIAVHMGSHGGYPLEVRHPLASDLETVKKYYDLIPEEDLERDFSNPAFLGGYTEGKMSCFIGLHREGAMGLLRVFPEYRRRGYAEKIYSTLTYEQIKRGAIPYCHVDVTNDASIALQKKLGFSVAKQPLAWLGPDW